MISVGLISTILAVIGVICSLINIFLAPKVEEERHDKAVKKYFENLAKKKEKK